MHRPRISVIIPTYNRSAFIRDAINSVLTQTLPVDEIIVVDDGSTDDTAALLDRAYGDRIRYLRQPNSGPASARNLGIAEATGDLLTFHDSDDIWLPEKIELQCSFLRQNVGVEFVFGDMAIFTRQPDFSVAEVKNPAIHAYLAENATHLTDLFDCLLIENVIPTPTVMITRHAVDRVGRFDERFKIAEDLDYWLRVARSCRCGFVNQVLLARRRHEDNLIGNMPLRNANLLSVLQKTAAELCPDCSYTRLLIDKKVQAISYDLGSVHLKRHEFQNARRYLKQARDAGGTSMKLRTKLIVALVFSHFCLF